MNEATVVDLIRHGEPVGGKMYRGHRDDPLSAKGWQQMRDAIGDHTPWQVIVSSTLVRCRAFAEEVALRVGVPLEFEPQLMEIGFGEWEGRTAEDILRTDPDAITRFWNDPLRFTPTGAERLDDFYLRVAAAWRAVLARHTGKHILLVGHAGVIRMIMREVLDIPLERIFRIDVPNAGITRIQIDGTGKDALPRMIFHAGVL